MLKWKMRTFMRFCEEFGSAYIDSVSASPKWKDRLFLFLFFLCNSTPRHQVSFRFCSLSRPAPPRPVPPPDSRHVIFVRNELVIPDQPEASGFRIRLVLYLASYIKANEKPISGRARYASTVIQLSESIFNAPFLLSFYPLFLSPFLALLAHDEGTFSGYA